jgi:hypothetical protein
LLITPGFLRRSWKASACNILLVGLADFGENFLSMGDGLPGRRGTRIEELHAFLVCDGSSRLLCKSMEEVRVRIISILCEGFVRFIRFG